MRKIRDPVISHFVHNGLGDESHAKQPLTPYMQAHDIERGLSTNIKRKKAIFNIAG